MNLKGTNNCSSGSGSVGVTEGMKQVEAQNKVSVTCQPNLSIMYKGGFDDRAIQL